MTPYKTRKQNARRERYLQATPPKAIVRLHRKPEMIHTGPRLSVAQMRSMYAVTSDQF